MAEQKEGAVDSSSTEAAPTDGDIHAAAEIVLAFVEDGLKAVVPTVYPSTTTEEILELLKRHEISSKYVTPQIRTAVAVAQETDHVVHDVVVAEGRPPKPAVARVEYHPPKGMAYFPVLDAVHKLLACAERDELISAVSDQRGWLVKAGQALVTLSFPDWAAGIDVRGQPIPPAQSSQAGGRDTVSPGPGVQVSKDGKSWTAQGYGYAGLLNGQVCVLSPIWHDAEEMEACFLRLSLVAGSVIPSSQRLRELLETSGVTSGIDEASVDSFAATQKQRDVEPLLAIARGKAGIPPKTPRPVFTIEESSKAGTVRRDQGMDFKKRNLIPSLEANALFSDCETTVPGEPGQTIRGEAIPVALPVIVELAAGELARAQIEDGIQRIFAEGEGGVSVDTEELRDEEGKRTIRHTVSVRSLLEIPGDVDYATGDIDFNGNVTIAGAVESGFSVKASGSIVIEGSVEPGVKITAVGAVTVKQGIIGSETSVKSESSVTAKYVQDARIKARADIIVDSYLYGAFVEAGGEVQVEGSGGGGIVGGETWALKSIRARNLGSEASTSTKLFAGLEPSQLPQLLDIRNAIRNAEEMLERLLATSGLPSFDEEEISKVAGHSESRQEAVTQVVKEAKQHNEDREARLQEEKELVESIANVSKSATIEVPEHAHPRIHLQIGSENLMLAQDEKHVRFRNAAEGGIVSSDLG